MKHLKQGLCLGLLAAGLVVVPTLQAQAGAPAAAGDRSIVDRLRAEADGTVSLSREPATGKIGFARVTGARADLMPGRAADSATTAAAKADAYLADYAAAFGAGAGELVRVQVQDDALGWTVSYRQSYRGVDVFGAMVRANLDRAGNLRAVNGYAAPDLDLSVAPDRSADQAGAAAVAAVKADPPGHDGDADTTGVEAVGTKLVVYRT